MAGSYSNVPGFPLCSQICVLPNENSHKTKVSFKSKMTMFKTLCMSKNNNQDLKKRHACLPLRKVGGEAFLLSLLVEENRKQHKKFWHSRQKSFASHKILANQLRKVMTLTLVSHPLSCSQLPT